MYKREIKEASLNLTINVPVVYMARNIMVLRRAKSITRGTGRGWTPEIKTFLGPEMATSDAQKSRDPSLTVS
jgi:hypothetical protein